MVAGRAEFREIFLAVQNPSGRLHPVVHEGRLHLSDGRAFESDLRVAPVLRGVGLALSDVRQTRPADEPDLAVHDEQLAMVPGIEPVLIDPEEPVVLFALHTLVPYYLAVLRV